MRDIAVTAVVFGLLPFILWRPHIGMLVWTWLGLMNPHRLCYTFAYDMPFAYHRRDHHVDLAVPSRASRRRCRGPARA